MVTDRGRIADAVIVGNTVRDLVTPEWNLTDGTEGIRIVGADHALVGSNTVSGLTTEFDEDQEGEGDGERGEQGERGERGEGDESDRRTGVVLLACRESRVHANTVERIGRSDPRWTDRLLGIHLCVFNRTTIEGNVCRRITADVDFDSHTPWGGLLVGDYPRDDADPGTDNGLTGRIGRYVSVVGERASYLIGPYTAFAHVSDDVSAIVSANTFTGAAQHPPRRSTWSGTPSSPPTSSASTATRTPPRSSCGPGPRQ